MSTITVKITKCDNPENWYKNRIGEVHEVFDWHDTWTLEVDRHKNVVRHIQKSDCCIVSEAIELKCIAKKGEFVKIISLGRCVSQTAFTVGKIYRLNKDLNWKEGFEVVSDNGGSINGYTCLGSEKAFNDLGFEFEKIADQDKPEDKTNLIAKAGTWVEILDNGPKNNALDRITINTPYQLREDLHTFGRFKIKKDNDGCENGYDCSRGMRFKIVPAPLESLPERWAIETNKNNYDSVYDYMETQALHYSIRVTNRFMHFPFLNHASLYDSIQEGYTLITDEQFDRWVLKKCTGNCGMNYCDENGCQERERHQTELTRVPPIMEKQELSIEEKKEMYNFLSSKSNWVLNYITQDEVANMRKDCAPDYITTIDKVELWGEETVYYLGNDTENTILDRPVNSIPAIFNRHSASTREAAEAYLKDNRMVKLNLINTILNEYSFLVDLEDEAAVEVINVKFLKEELSKLSNQ